MQKQHKHLSLINSGTHQDRNVDLVWQLLIGEQDFVAFDQRVDVIAANSGPVLITGDSGTGKSTIAQQIHQRSPRAQYPNRL